MVTKFCAGQNKTCPYLQIGQSSVSKHLHTDVKLIAELSLVSSQMMVRMLQSPLNRLRLVSPHCAAVVREELKRLVRLCKGQLTFRKLH